MIHSPSIIDILTQKKVALLLAISLPWLITPIAFLISSFMPKANLSLMYLIIVICMAIKYTLPITIINAVSSFLAFNYFFTAPRGSLLITHREDLLTVIFFLLTALLVGHLASRLKKNISDIQLHEEMTGIELDLLDSLSKALNEKAVINALHQALMSWKNDNYLLIDDTYDFSSDDLSPHLYEMQKSIRGLFREKVTEQKLNEFSVTENELKVKILHDNKKVVALFEWKNDMDSARRVKFLNLLVRQTNIALERTRLMADLTHERIAKENESLRSALLSSVSHDFRTPLTTMIGASSTILELGDQLSKPQINELLTTIMEEAQRLNRYTQNLLDMTRLGFGELRLERHWISIEDIISSIKKRISPLLADNYLEINLAPTLPLLHVHAALIEQAIFNALENAVKFSPANSIININIYLQNNRMVIDVSDQGPGIPDDEKERVFERFHTATRGDRRKSGSGLGLTICRGMIAAHGGKVSIHDNRQPGAFSARGCCVRMDIPLEKPGVSHE